MADFTNTDKSASPTWFDKIRHGRDIKLGDISSKTFTDSIFEDDVELKDLTFEQLSDQSWTNKDKSADPTWADTTRN